MTITTHHPSPLIGESPRAKLMAKLHTTIDTSPPDHDTAITSMKLVSQHNDWVHDEESLGHPYLSIGARGDLETDQSELASMTGGLDGKVISAWESFYQPDGSSQPIIHGRVGPSNDVQVRGPSTTTIA